MKAPTLINNVALAEGAGTRAFASVSTNAGDWLAIGIITEQNSAGESFPPSGGGLTYLNQTDGGTGGGDCRVLTYTAPDSAGSATRTVTITPSSGTRLYRAHLLVLRDCGGPGTGKGATITAQSMSIARQGDNSAMLMGMGDFSAGAVGAPVWHPNGFTLASQQGSGATYLFGYWEFTDTAETETVGVVGTTYSIPSFTALEMLGTADTPPTQEQMGVNRKIPRGRRVRR